MLLGSIVLEEVHVNSDDGSHFQITAIGDIFSGISPLEREKLIHRVLKELIVGKQIHAVSIKAYTLMEWKKHREFSAF